MNYAYLIYQIKDSIKCNYAWMSWKTAKRDINPMDYDGVYYGRSIDGENPIAVLENLYEMFNINHPLDFNGHSLSVSDIVVLFDDNIYTGYQTFSRFRLDMEKCRYWKQIVPAIKKAFPDIVIELY